MSHSRNVAFLAAAGEIVNNVDADNWTNAGFAAYVNRLANQCPRKAIFAKGKRLLRGRIGFFKDEWVDMGGYDERFEGYGYEDIDILHRAWTAGYTLMWYGGDYVHRLETLPHMKVARMKNQDGAQTAEAHKALSEKNIEQGRYRVNDGFRWGAAWLVKNFKEEIEVGRTTTKHLKNVMVANRRSGAKVSEAGLRKLLDVQIENSLMLGWKPEDIVIIANFPYEHGGVSAKPAELNGSCLRGSKVFALDFMFREGMVEPDAVYWAHDLDA